MPTAWELDRLLADVERLAIRGLPRRDYQRELTARLRALEEAGVVERRAYSERPPRHEYHLTDAGRDLAPVVTALAHWGSTWLYDEPPVVFHHRDHVAVLDTTPTCTACGSPADHLTLRP